MLTRRQLLAALAAPARPNVIVILTDDQGYGDLGCFGAADARTPHWDRLAAEGIRFTDWHANSPVCSPSRASVLTGKYPQRTGIAEVLNSKPTFDVAGLRRGEVSLARELQKAGYRTAAVGKWHLGSEAASRPRAQGFDEFYGFYSGWVDYYSQRYYTLGGNPGASGPPPQNIFHDFWDNEKEIYPEPQHQTALLGRRAVEFVRRQQAGQPFFLYLAFGAPHYPMMAPANCVERFPATMDRDRRLHLAMIADIDDQIGALRAELQRKGMARNTVVFFQADNGATEETRADHAGRPYRGGSNGPWRAFKGSLFEGGHRVPAMIAWPGQLRPRVERGTGMGMDVLPTMLGLAGVALPPGIDGSDLSGALRSGAPWPERTLHWEYSRQRAVRKGEWKLTVNPRPSLLGPNENVTWLANLQDDPGETRNLAAERPEVLADLQKDLTAWRW
ncbi:MAG: sulfatase-like hydrolase/transferase [Acidobacteriaceae bacterium]|nr:sulfatase-like hydrolase/transferase [Acidobacteriaceae bacterium]